MRVPSLKRPMATWGFLLDLLRALTQPSADVGRCDARVEALMSESRIGRGLSAIAKVWRRATGDSIVVAVYRRRLRRLIPVRLVERVRAAGCVTAAAAATTLILRLWATDRDPLGWALPTAVGCLGALVFFASESIARAIADFHS